jgi:peptidoglycan/LPS O-acetylase OafA/YrhL
MKLIGSLRWAASSLLGHVVGFALLYSVPLCVTFLGMTYNEGTLDVPSALWIVFVCGLTGIIVATLFWYIVSRPLVKRRKDRS